MSPAVDDGQSEPAAAMAGPRLPVATAIRILLLGVIAALAIASVRLDSATADEGAHIAAGIVKLRYGWLSFYPEQPPLMNVITALPLAQYEMPPGWKSLRPEGHWSAGHELLYLAGHDAHRLLLLARLPTIALFLILCLAVDLFVTAETRNRTWGLLALTLTGFCPNLMAHGRLATVDLAVSAFSFFAFVFFLRMLRRGSPLAPVAVGVLSAAALLSKTSGALLAPFFAIVLVVHVWRTRELRRLVVPLLVCIAAALITIEVVTLGLASSEYLAKTFPDTPRLLVPFVQYQQQLASVARWYREGIAHPQFLLGSFSQHGFPHYYLVSFLLKTPIAAQILLIVAVVVAFRRDASPVLRSCLLFVVLLLGVSVTSHIALGIRYVLPIYPFMYAAIAIAMARAYADASRKRIAAMAFTLLVSWHLVSSVIAWPSYVSYFNELIGSHRNADRFLIDSNLDWGADLVRLKRWADANGVDFIRIDYFGGGEPAYEFGGRAERWPAPRNRPLPKGWFAVSRHFYRTSFDLRESPVDYDTYLAWSKARYVTTVGGSIDVYRVD